MTNAAPGPKRKTYLVSLAALACATPHLVPQTSQPTKATVVIRDVTVLPMDSAATLPDQNVIIRDGKVQRVGAERDVPVPSGAIVIDGRGKYLAPGLADMHVHLAQPEDPPDTAESQLMLYLANGVTTVRNMAGFPKVLEVRDKVARGEALGPTIITAGPVLNGESAKTPADGEQAVREQRRLGYDLIKVLPGLSRPTYDAIANTAHEVGIPFVGHVPTDVGILHAIEMGQQTIEHLDGYIELRLDYTPLTEEKLHTFVQRTLEAGVWNVPTMAVMEANLGIVSLDQLRARPELAYSRDATVQESIQIRMRDRAPKELGVTMERDRMRLLKALNTAHARIMFGTDAPELFTVPGFTIYHEMKLMAEAGMSNYEVFRSATEQVGEYTQKSCGVIKAGACADLILVDANPLEDLNNLRRLSGVMVHGRWLGRTELQRYLDTARGRPGNYHVPISAQ
jgi:imidazolonepropionase-like amidohydrolase